MGVGLSVEAEAIQNLLKDCFRRLDHVRYETQRLNPVGAQTVLSFAASRLRSHFDRTEDPTFA